MVNLLPDLNDEPNYEEPELFYYSLNHGYACPDSVDGFGDLNEVENYLVSTPFVRIPFDQDLADSHFEDKRTNNLGVLVKGDVGVVVEEEKDLGVNHEKKDVVEIEEDDDLDVIEEEEDPDVIEELGADGVRVKRRKTEYEIKRDGSLNEFWKDCFLTFCPAASSLPEFKGGIFLHFYVLFE